jgi:hypothetical protein
VRNSLVLAVEEHAYFKVGNGKPQGDEGGGKAALWAMGASSSGMWCVVAGTQQHSKQGNKQALYRRLPSMAEEQGERRRARWSRLLRAGMQLPYLQL